MRADLSDKDREARAPRARAETRPMRCRSRAATRRERVERAREQPARAARDRRPTRAAQAQTRADAGVQSGARSPTAAPPAARRHRTAPSGAQPTAGGSLGDALRNLQRYVQPESFDNPQGGTDSSGRDSVRHQGRRVRAVDPTVRRAGEAELVRSERRDVDAAAASSSRSTCTRDGAITDLTIVGPCPIEAFNKAAYGALRVVEPDRSRCRRSTRRTRRSSP